jgi:uncharacterized membrane protein
VAQLLVVVLDVGHLQSRTVDRSGKNFISIFPLPIEIISILSDSFLHIPVILIQVVAGHFSGFFLK